MALFELTSQRSGRTFTVDFEREPTEMDVDEAIVSLDTEADEQEVLSQGPVESGVKTAARDFGPSLTTRPLAGIAGMLDKATDVVADLTGTQKGGLFGDVAEFAQDVNDEAERVLPTNPNQPVANAIGSGVSQGLGLLSGMGALRAAGASAQAMTALPLAIGAASGAGEGLATAEEFGIDTPEKALAMGALFGGVELLTEKLGGFGSREATQALIDTYRKPAGEILKKAVKTTLGEGVEEPLAGLGQDLITRAFADEDPENPGFTRTGVELPKLTDLEKRKLEMIGGMAGGAVFAGAQVAANVVAPREGEGDNQTIRQSDNQTGAATVEGGVAETFGASTGRTTLPDGRRVTFDVGALTPDALAAMTPETLAQAFAAGMVAEEAGQSDNQTVRRSDSAATAAGGPGGANAAGPGPGLGGSDARVDSGTSRELDQLAGQLAAPPQERTLLERDPTIGSNAQVRLGQAAPMAPNRPTLPPDATGSEDILNWLTLNPILAPKRGTDTEGGEYDWREAGEFPPKYRRAIMRQGRPNMDERAQAAFEEGLINEPTPDALVAEIRSAIENRETLGQAQRQQEQRLAAAEAARVRFDEEQARLASRGDAETQSNEVDADALAVGDRIAVGESVYEVVDVQMDEDGRTLGYDVQTADGQLIGVDVSEGGMMRGEVQTIRRSDNQTGSDVPFARSRGMRAGQGTAVLEESRDAIEAAKNDRQAARDQQTIDRERLSFAERFPGRNQARWTVARAPETESARAAERLGQALGVRVVWFHDRGEPGALRGWQSTERRTLFLNQNLATNRAGREILAPINVVAHELVHILRVENAAVYDELAAWLKPRLNEGGIRQVLQELGYDPAKGENLDEEAVAHLAGELAMRPEFHEQLLTEKPGLARRIGEVIRAVLKRIERAFLSGLDAQTAAGGTMTLEEMLNQQGQADLAEVVRRMTGALRALGVESGEVGVESGDSPLAFAAKSRKLRGDERTVSPGERSFQSGIDALLGPGGNGGNPAAAGSADAQVTRLWQAGFQAEANTVVSATGNEHVVEFRDGRAYKETKPETYGIKYDPANPNTLAPATPLEYLQRWKLFNELHPDADVRFEGVVMHADGSVSLKISQPFIEGLHPTAQEIESKLTKWNWTSVSLNTWEATINGRRVRITDAKPENFIVDGAERLVAVDLAIEELAAPAAAKGTRQSQFGERVREDERRSEGFREAEAATFEVRPQQRQHNEAKAIIEEMGLARALDYLQNDPATQADGIERSVRIAGLMQIAQNYDVQHLVAARRGDEASMAEADRLLEKAIEAKVELELLGNETGRALAMYNTWARLSPNGMLERFGKKLRKKQREGMEFDLGLEPGELKAVTRDMGEAIGEAQRQATDEILNEVMRGMEGFQPVPIREPMLKGVLAGIGRIAGRIAESATLGRLAQAADDALKAIQGRLYSDPFLLTPLAQAALRAVRDSLRAGMKFAAAVEAGINQAITETGETNVDRKAAAKSIAAVMTQELVRPILSRLALDDTYAVKQAAADLEAAGVTKGQAAQVARDIAGKRKSIRKRSAASATKRMLKRLAPKKRAQRRKQRMPKVIATLMDAQAQGLLDQEITEAQVMEAYGKAFKLPGMTPEQTRKLQGMAAELNRLPEGVLRADKAREFLNELALIEGIPASEALMAMWYANILSGLGTQGVNVWGNGIMALVKGFAVMASSPREAGRYVRGLLGPGLKQGRAEAAAALRKGVGHKHTLKWDDAQRLGALELLSAQGSPKTAAQWLAYVGSLGTLTRYVFRALGAMDVLFYYSANEGMTHLATARALRKQNLKPGTRAFEAEFVKQLGGDGQQWVADLEQARDELRAAGQNLDPGLIQRRAYELRLERRTKDVRETAERWADRLTFQQDPEGVGQWLSKVITEVQRFRPLGVPVGRLLVPFNRIVSNLFENALDFTPIGVARAIKGGHLTGKGGVMDTVERRERALSSALGFALAGLLYALTKHWDDDDEVDAPFRLYGQGPAFGSSQRANMPEGWRPYTIKMGDKYVSYAETPMGPFLAAVGSWLDMERYSASYQKKTLNERAYVAFQAAMKGFTSQGVLSSVADGLEVLSGETMKSPQSILGNPARGAVPASGLIKDIGEIFDPGKISDDDIWGALVKDVPVVKNYGTLPDRNWRGEPISQAGAPVVRRFVTGQRLDPESAWLGRNKLRIPQMPAQILVGQYTGIPQTRQGNALVEAYARRGLQLTALENGAFTREQWDRFTQRAGTLTAEGVMRLRKQLEAKYPQGRVPETLQERLQTQVETITQAARKTAMLEEMGRVR